MIYRHHAFERSGLFWRELRVAIDHGIRDNETAFDRVAYDWLDPRVEGGGTLAYALTRALATSWRMPEGRDPLGVVVMAGTIDGGRVSVRNVPLDAWPTLESVHFVADGPLAVTSHKALTRRMRIDAGLEVLKSLFGEDVQCPGDLVLIVGAIQGDDSDPLVAAAARGLEEHDPGVGILMLYEGNAAPVDIGDAGGPMRNGFRPKQMAEMHMSDSHVSLSYLSLMREEQHEVWYDPDFRSQVFNGMKAAAAERQMDLNKEAFYNALAEGSPLRRLLPYHLTKLFPEAERIFWCTPEVGIPGIDPLVWDESSPLERLALLSQVKVDAHTG